MANRCDQGSTELKTQSATAPAVVGPFIKLVGADFVARGDGAGYYTVQFNVFRPTALGSVGFYSAQAKVTWTVKGQHVYRQYDVGQGSVISGCGEGITVEVADTTPQISVALAGTVTLVNGSTVLLFTTAQSLPQGIQITFDDQPGVIYTIAATTNASVNANLSTPYTGPGGAGKHATVNTLPGAAYTVTCNVTPGTRPSQNQPPTLEGITDGRNGSIIAAGSRGFIGLNAGASASYPIPPGAISVEVTVAPPAGGGGSVGLIAVSQLAAAAVSVKQYDPAVMTGFVALAANATAVLVSNPTANPQGIALTFGIEG